jgi:hypothetical protein
MPAEEATVMEPDSKWKLRPPPRGVPRESLALCGTVAAGGVCRLVVVTRQKVVWADAVSRLGANCVEAHSAAELEEWTARWQDRLGSEGPRSYSDLILDEVLKDSKER